MFSPIACGKKIDLKGNIEAVTLRLSDEEIEEIDNSWPFDIGFPLSFLSQTPAEQRARVTWRSSSSIENSTMSRR
jgi:hypothetical protein